MFESDEEINSTLLEARELLLEKIVFPRNIHSMALRHLILWVKVRKVPLHA